MNAHDHAAEHILSASRLAWAFGRAALFAMVVLAAGCVVIPTQEHDLLAGRGQIDQSDIEFLQAGTTTRQDVLLRFGEPDAIICGQSILAYRWVVSRGIWIVVAASPSGAGTPGGGVAAGHIPRTYMLLLEFDVHGRLKRSKWCASTWWQSIVETVEGTGGRDLLDEFVGLEPDAPPPHPEATLGPGSAAGERIGKWASSGRKRRAAPPIIIDPKPRLSDRADAPDASAGRVRFGIGKFRDRRELSSTDTLVGHKKAYGVIVADIHTCRRPIDIVRLAVIDQLVETGHRLVHRDADIVVTGELVEFKVATPTTLGSWDAVGSLEFVLEARPARGAGTPVVCRYRTRKVANSFFEPSAKHLEQALRACLENMQQAIARDAELAKLLR